MRRERVKFAAFDFTRGSDGSCRARVVLVRGAGQDFVGEAEGSGSPTGELRCAAVATAAALENAVEGALRFELLGVKAVRAFDATVVIVSLSCHNGGPAVRLVGSCLRETDLPRGASLAVLNATNRVLGNAIFVR
ncbi:MAG TPA: hypothetical protein VGA22_14345 [Gemmatimonadales bacterium]|jgi:hypothetical protein